jgi:predicted SAM-dependent methyltransferase
MRLDIGCGQSKQEGFTGIDIAEGIGADIVHDLNQYPWPVKDGEVEEAFCSHVVEHVGDLIAFMNEVHRVLAKDALIRIVHPYCKSQRAFQDPTHVRFIPEATWSYFNAQWREANRLDHYPIDCDFEITSISAVFADPWQLRSQDAQQFAMRHYWDVVNDLVVDMKKR